MLQRELIHVVVQVPGPVRRQARQNIIEKRDSVALLDQSGCFLPLRQSLIND